MASKSCKPEQSNWLTPYLWVKDVSEAMQEYQQAFGFEAGTTMPGSTGKIAHGEMNYQGRLLIMLGAEGLMGVTLRSPQTSGAASPVGLYVYCEDVDQVASQAVAAGMTLVDSVQDMFWGDRIANLRDSNGYAWTFATRVGEFDPSKAPPM